MANNPYVNKVQLADGTTVIDISDTTAEAADVASGKEFYTANGAKAVGTGLTDPNALTLTKDNATDVSSNDNYNNYTTPGNYRCVDSATAGTLSNCPVTTGHRLFVMSIHASGRLVQIIVGGSYLVPIWMRYYNGTTWHDWRKMISSANYPDAPSSDGTYILQCTVSSGTAAYTWVSTPAAEGVSF